VRFNVKIPDADRISEEDRKKLGHLGQLIVGGAWFGSVPEDRGSAMLIGMEAEMGTDAARIVAGLLRVRQDTLYVTRTEPSFH
jgi:hypothetical protein